MPKHMQFYKAYYEVEEMTDLDSYSKRVFAYICSLNQPGKRCFATNNKICEVLALSLRTVERSINRLKYLKLIQVEYEGGARRKRKIIDFITHREERRLLCGKKD